MLWERNIYLNNISIMPVYLDTIKTAPGSYCISAINDSSMKAVTNTSFTTNTSYWIVMQLWRFIPEVSTLVMSWLATL